MTQLKTSMTPAAAAALPASVRRHVECALATLQVLARGRQTDARFGGTGRYEAEVYLNHQAHVERAWATLTEFETLCPANGVDAQAVYAELGAPEQLSEAARAWLAECRPAAERSSADRGLTP